MAKNEKYSHKDFTHQDLTNTPASEFNNSTIVNSCFYQEIPEGRTYNRKQVFPSNIVNVIFENCNLDNVIIPAGATCIKCSNRKIFVQNDRFDWILGVDNKPVEPMYKKSRIRNGVSIDPKDIPTRKLTDEEFDNFKRTFT